MHLGWRLAVSITDFPQRERVNRSCLARVFGMSRVDNARLAGPRGAPLTHC